MCVFNYCDREASLRVMFPIHKDYNDVKIELKIMDHTANPYLSAAAICIAGMQGKYCIRIN